ncbi:MAG: hypothetical protein QOD53_219, partial [Thermoleophilaceae bacterium]|nr:hypothetical protein [Thermoleophilaceae bacterium]
AALAAGGDYVFQCGGGAHQFQLTGQLTATKDVSLDATGQNFKILAKGPPNSERVFNVTGGTLTLTNLHLVGFDVHGADGAAGTPGTAGAVGATGSSGPVGGGDGGTGGSGGMGGAGGTGAPGAPGQGGLVFVGPSATVTINGGMLESGHVFGGNGGVGGAGGAGGSGGHGGDATTTSGGTLGNGGDGGPGGSGGNGGTGSRGGDGQGGAVYVSATATLNLGAVTLFGNGATPGNGGAGGGGGHGGGGGDNGGGYVGQQGGDGAGGGGGGLGGDTGAAHGGAVYSKGTVNLTGTTLSSDAAGNKSGAVQGPGGAGGAGGAGGSGADASNCACPGQGGAGANGGNGGKAGSQGESVGGAVYNDGGQLTVVSASFMDNVAFQRTSMAAGGNGGQAGGGGGPGPTFGADGPAGNGGQGGNGGNSSFASLGGTASTVCSATYSGSQLGAGPAGPGGGGGLNPAGNAAIGSPGASGSAGVTGTLDGPTSGGVCCPVSHQSVRHSLGHDCALVVNEKGDESDADLNDGHCDHDLATPDDQCTLRAAIQEANARAGDDFIRFDIPGGGRPTIKPSNPLPAINDKLSINGFSQPSAPAGEPGVELDGSSTPGGTIGLRVSASDSVVKGLVVNRFPGAGIQVGSGDGSKIQGNWLGMGFSGGAVVNAGNAAGVEVKAPNTLIGGPDPADRNVISGSGNLDALHAMLNQLQGASHVSDSQLQALIGAAGVGVFVSGPGAAGTQIQNNLIGLAPDGKRTGSLADPNGNYGNAFGIAVIPIGGSLNDVTVGGDTKAEGNVISGNFIGLLGTGTDKLKVFNNLIGPGPDEKPVGPAPFGNSIGAMVVGKGSGIQIGKPGAANKIQGNFMGLVAGGPAGMKIQSNEIGVDQTLLGFGQDLKAAIDANQAPTMGLHNILGVMMVATNGAVLGGSRAAGEGNRILGDITGVFLGGPGSANNRVIGNDIGTSKKPVKAIQQLKASDMGGLIGLVLAAGSGQHIGEPGNGNDISGNMFGALDVATRGDVVQSNNFGSNVLGITGFNVTDSTFGGPGAGNRITGGAVGFLGVQHEFTAPELTGAELSQNDVQRSDREAVLSAPAMQQPLEMTNGLTSSNVDAHATDFDPVAAARSARRRGDVRAAAAPNAKSTNDTFQGNAVGTDAGGSTRAGNAFGLWFFGGIRNMTFGGDQPGDGNVIAHNVGAGMMLGPGINGDWPSEVKLRGNRIFDNHQPGQPFRGLGFDLLELGPQTRIVEDLFGPSPPDVGDVDDGANTLQNAPVLGAASPKGSKARIVGTLNSAPKTAYQVEFFGNSRCGAFGYGEGERPLGVVTMTTDGSGDAPFDGHVTLPSNAKAAVTAMATGPNGTSEFSNCQKVQAADVALAPGSLTPDAKGNVTVTVFCLDAAKPCNGGVDLTQGSGNTGSPKLVAAKKKSRKLGSKRFKIRKGGKGKVKIHLSKAALKKLKKAKALRVKATAKLRKAKGKGKGKKGGRRSASVTWTLHARPAKHK